MCFKLPRSKHTDKWKSVYIQPVCRKRLDSMFWEAMIWFIVLSLDSVPRLRQTFGSHSEIWKLWSSKGSFSPLSTESVQQEYVWENTDQEPETQMTAHRL